MAVLDNDLLDKWLNSGMVGLDTDSARELIEELQSFRDEAADKVKRLEKQLEEREEEIDKFLGNLEERFDELLGALSTDLDPEKEVNALRELIDNGLPA